MTESITENAWVLADGLVHGLRIFYHLIGDLMVTLLTLPLIILFGLDGTRTEACLVSLVTITLATLVPVCACIYSACVLKFNSNQKWYYKVAFYIVLALTLVPISRHLYLKGGILLIEKCMNRTIAEKHDDIMKQYDDYPRDL